MMLFYTCILINVDGFGKKKKIKYEILTMLSPAIYHLVFSSSYDDCWLSSSLVIFYDLFIVGCVLQ